MPQIDDLVADRYRVESKLGQGGMGVVFGVRHLGIDRQYAMKVLSPKLSLDDDYRERFMREAKINARLSHANVVQVYDSGVYDGLLYIVMEYLRGTPLSELLWAKQIGGLEEVIEIGRQISDALQAAHDIGLIHRDLKLDNVLVEHNEESGKRRCVLLDFGLAYIEQSAELGRITQDSTSVAGTPLYMSPEQISSAPLTAATDIYSLGCMIYELIAGETPFEGGGDVSVIKVMSRHMFMAPKPLRHHMPDVPLALDEHVLRMLSKDANLRPTAKECASFFREVLHLPSVGRGGVIQSRAARQVQEPTARGEQATTARLYTKKRVVKQSCQVGLLGLSMSEDHQLALASAGYEVETIEDLEALEDKMFVLIRTKTMEDIELLVEECNVVAFVEPSGIAHAAEYLRAGVIDVIPHDAGIEELITRFDRVKKRLLRARKREERS